MRISAGGEPFFFKGSDVGCLLVHGFPGAPQEMVWLGESLHQRGYTVLGVRLFGHATDPSDLLHVHADDWLSGLEDGYHILRGHCSHIILIGLSVGAVLSATIASSLSAHGLVLMAMPMNLPPLAHRLRPLMPVLKYVWRFRKPPEPSDWVDKEAERLNLHYPVQPVPAIGQVLDLIEQLPQKLINLHLPTLVISAELDSSVAADHGELAFEAIAAEDKTYLQIKGSGHNLPRDAQREVVFHRVGEFVHRVCEADG